METTVSYSKTVSQTPHFPFSGRVQNFSKFTTQTRDISTWSLDSQTKLWLNVVLCRGLWLAQKWAVSPILWWNRKSWTCFVQTGRDLPEMTYNFCTVCVQNYTSTSAHRGTIWLTALYCNFKPLKIKRKSTFSKISFHFCGVNAVRL